MDIISQLHMERVLTVVPTRVASVAAIHCVPHPHDPYVLYGKRSYGAT
jgi:hypothetical protein